MNVSRIYKYTDDDGNVYWSFHRRPQTVSQVVRLVLESRIGTNTYTFLVELRQKVESVLRGGGVKSPAPKTPNGGKTERR